MNLRFSMNFQTWFSENTFNLALLRYKFIENWFLKIENSFISSNLPQAQLGNGRTL